MDPHADRAASTDEEQGITWWNSLSEAKRLLWLQLAGGPAVRTSAASAWAASGQANAQPMSAARSIDTTGHMHTGAGDH